MATEIGEPWSITEAAFPAGSTPAEQLRFLVHYAVLAPSGHNTQPWHFRIHDEALELIADRTRALPVADPDDRELTIACGAALVHLRLALHHFGFAGHLALLPDPADPDLLARVHLGEPTTPMPEDEALFRAIPLRRTNRRPFAGRPLPPDLPPALETAARQEGAWWQALQDAVARVSVADLVAEGDRRQWDDPEFRRELASWLHPSRRGDGLPDLYLHGIGPIVVGTLDLGASTARKDRDLAEEAPLLAVLGTDRDSAGAWLNVGQAQARVLLRARVDGIDASYLNQPIQVPALRPALAAAIGRPDGYPQVLLRMGYGPQVPPSPRRPVHEVLVAQA